MEIANHLHLNNIYFYLIYKYTNGKSLKSTHPFEMNKFRAYRLIELNSSLIITAGARIS